ncbi:efflux RND transporter periplasmic adaptor subunit [Aliidiomarina sp. Khilg15.8]
MRYPFVALLSALTLTAALSGCQNADAGNAVTEESKSEPAIPVEVVTADRATLHASFSTTTMLEALEEADVIARVGGIVEEIMVEEGDFVNQGDVLARIEEERFAMAVQQVKAELRGVQQELQRMQEMAKKQMASADAVERLQANHDALQARLRLAELDLEAATVRAPISGFIATRYVKPGNLIQQHERKGLFHIVDMRTLQAVLHLPERDVYKVKPGQHAELSLNASNTTVSASVLRISPAVDDITGTFRVTLQVDNSEQQLRDGMFARARLNYQQQDNALRVPHYALINVDDSHHVFRVENDLAQRTPVKTGIRDGQWVEITEGLSPGDEVVITGQNQLSDAARVSRVGL